MSEVKFEKEKQKKIKGLSKAIYILAKIGKILITISIPFIILLASVVTYFVANINISENSISLNNFNEKIEFIENNENNQMILKIGDNEINLTSEIEGEADKNFSKEIIKEFMRNLNKTTQFQKIVYVVLVSSIIIANLIFIRIILGHLEQLFKNIKDAETPFTLENVGHLKKMAYYMIATIVTPVVLMCITKIITSLDADINLEIANIIEILFLFAIANIFEYGYEIQKDSDGKIYDEE